MIAGLPSDMLHTRDEWEDPAYPVDGPRAIWENITTVALHYTGADDVIDGDPGEAWDRMDDYLRAIQQSYVTQRGYSVGYMFAVDQRGHVWQLRGWEYKSAANRGWNHCTLPILFLVDGGDMASPMAVRSANLVITEGERRAGRRLVVKPHKDIGATACPGVGITAQQRAGVFHSVVVNPPPKPPQGVPDMFHPIAPIRNSDTRRFGKRLVGGQEYEFVLDPSIPSNVMAAALNVAVVDAPGVGWLQIWPAGQDAPDTTVVNYDAGSATNGATVVGTPNRRFMVRANRAVHVVVDVTGYWVP